MDVVTLGAFRDQVDADNMMMRRSGQTELHWMPGADAVKR